MQTFERFLSVLTAALFSLLVLGAGAFAATLTVTIGTYDTSVYKTTSFTVPVSVQLQNGTGTVTVTINPDDGLSCSDCENSLTFSAAGTQSTSFTIRADNTGTYTNPFSVTASASGVTPATDSTSDTVTVSEKPSWTISFTSSDSSVVAGDSVTLTLSISVSDTVDGATADLSLPSSGWTKTSGADPHSFGSISGTESASWTVRADSPSSSNTISVSLSATDPPEAFTRSVSISGPSEEGAAAEEGVTLVGEAGAIVATSTVTLAPGTSVATDTVLQNSIAAALGLTSLDAATIAALQQISAAITSKVQLTRELSASAATSILISKLTYSGDKVAKNLMIVDSVPKTFAASADNITVTAPGASVSVVIRDPKYLFTYASVSPGQELSWNYTVTGMVPRSVVNETSAELYAQRLEAAAPPAAPPAAPVIPPEVTIAGAKIQTATIIAIVVIAAVIIAAVVLVRRKKK